MSDNVQDTEQENINNENDEKGMSSETAPKIGEPVEGNTEIVSMEEKVDELQDKYLRLSAEFDNYRKRTLKERYELIKTAGEDTIQGLLPVIDDFDRAIAAMNQSEDVSAVREGIMLIYDKLISYLKQKGLSEIETLGKEFDTNNSEAIAKLAVPEKDKKGKVIDVVQKGYMLNDKVIRYAKVVVGE
ncbi:MAG: nucleotide exchange factor GrpE [Prevotellaceae bacterium]|jgi:molecular chaperone GrpE|nr:nucleotide exchange factor GrpE [Prevotellaceae bacterium]